MKDEEYAALVLRVLDTIRICNLNNEDMMRLVVAGFNVAWDETIKRTHEKKGV